MKEMNDYLIDGVMVKARIILSAVQPRVFMLGGFA